MVCAGVVLSPIFLLYWRVMRQERRKGDETEVVDEQAVLE